MAIISNLVARLRADTASFDKNMKKSRTHMTRFGKDVQRMGKQMLALAGVGGGLYMLNRGLRGAFRAFMEQEKAERALMAATGQSIDTFKKYAAEIQKVTIYGDELILSQMAYAKNLGVSIDQLKDATTAAIGLAAKYRLDLATSMMLVGRASQGQTQMLTRYGIVLNEKLSDQEKFNAVLKIGAEAFRLAEEETETLEGAWTQFKNNVGDFAEDIVKAYLDVAKGLNSVAKNYSGVEKSAEKAHEEMKKLKEAMPNFTALMPGLFYYPSPTPKKPVGPVLDPNSPAGIMAQRRKDAEAEAKALIDAAKEYSDILHDQAAAEFQAKMDRIAALSDQHKKILEIAPKYAGLINKEIELTGRVGEARWHAAQMQKFENEMKQQGVTDTKSLNTAMEAMRKKLKELEGVQRLARIADDIGSSFADAFEDMIFEAKKFEDVMKSVMRSIARSVMQNLITQPLGLQISGMIGGLFGLGGGLPKVGSVPSQAGATLTKYQHGGWATGPTVALLGEREPELVTPLSKLGGLMNQQPPDVNIIINIEGGVPLRQEGPPQMNGRDIVVRLVSEAVDHDISFRRKMGITR